MTDPTGPTQQGLPPYLGETYRRPQEPASPEWDSLGTPEPSVRLENKSIGSKRKLFVLTALVLSLVGLLGPLVQKGGWVWTAFCIPPGVILLYLGVFRVPRTGTIDLDGEGMYVCGIFIDHKVRWDENPRFEVTWRSGEGITWYRPTVYRANGKSFWISGFISRDDREAQATVSRLNAERDRYLRDLKRIPGRLALSHSFGVRGYSASRRPSGLVKLFATAVAREDEVESDVAPGWTLHGREFPKGAVLKLHGPRHAMGGDGRTFCGIPKSELVLLGAGFAPESPGACSMCQVELERWGEELDEAHP